MASLIRMGVFFILLASLPATSFICAQSLLEEPPGSDSKFAQDEVVFTTLLQPTYPRLARQAGITGDVQVKVTVRKDGSLVSATVAGGHPLLGEAALKSAQGSHFECRVCEHDTTYSVTYSFQLIESPGYPCPEISRTRIVQEGAHVMVIADPPIVAPYFSHTRVRSFECLYLWACGSQWGGEDYYFYSAPSLKCLNLWNCGHRLREPFETCKKLHRELVN